MKTVPIKQLQTKLLRWYAAEKRDLPWRKTTDPYRIAVSEVMLQQTQVSRVIPKYEAWLKAFPTARKLAAASLSDVLRLWSGLGYNRRAKNLHAAAKVVAEDFDGRWPTEVDELLKLSGFGAYTARAVAIFSTNQPLAAVDTNIRRVVTRWVAGTKTWPEKKLMTTVAALVPTGQSSVWHHGLMDLGATVCLPAPLCGQCPVKAECRAYPKILSQTRPAGRAKERFIDSNRFVRGQILKFLLVRHSGTTQRQLQAQLHQQVGIEPVRVTTAVSQLLAEQLIEQRGRFLKITD